MFNFLEMSLLLAEHEGWWLGAKCRSPYIWTVGWMPDISNNLVFSLFCHGTEGFLFKKYAAQTSIKPHDIGIMFSNG